MPRNSTYRHYGLNDQNKRTFEVKQFKGVDYTPAQLNVADNHAVEISNIVYKNNVNQKRNGWEQIAKVNPVTYYVRNNDGTYTQKTNTTNVNGIWSFIAEDGNKYTIAHIGRLLFNVKNFGSGKSFLDAQIVPLTQTITENNITYNIAKELNDEKSQAFYGFKRLYILGGNKYLVLKIQENKFILNEVEDDVETYIPTTTVGITYKNSVESLAAPLDDLNMLTQYRKNKLVSGIGFDTETQETTDFFDYELDSSINPKSPIDINNISVDIHSLKEV